MRVIALVQARMGSTRLPGKVLHDLDGESVLERVVRAVRASDAVADVVVATTEEAIDDAVAARCAQVGVACHRGPTDDVLTRFIGAIDAVAADAIVRITADCPLLDPAIVRLAVSAFRAADVDYLSTALHRTLPRGLDVEVVTSEALRRADAAATAHDRVHVTSHIYSHQETFRLVGLSFHPPAADLRVTLDTQEDLALIERVIAMTGDRLLPWEELVAWLRANPDVVALNAHVEQKALVEG